MITTARLHAEASLEQIEVSAYRIPTQSPESDGTHQGDSATLVLVEVEGGGRRALGDTYASTAAARLIRDT